MRLEHPRTTKPARVEMIPLIDCMFILLVFFIYSMLNMTVQRGIVVQLPVARAVQSNQDDAVVLTITDQGELLVNKEPVTLDGLGDALRRVRQARENPRFVINADTASRHGWFVRVLDELRTQGITQVMILSEEDGGS